MIDGIMRKLGYINEKELIDVAIYVYEENASEKAKDEKTFWYNCGNANAINYLMSKLGIKFTEIMKDRRRNEE